MRTVITIRATQSGLHEAIRQFTKCGWTVTTIAGGAEFGRVASSYKWTVVLERPDDDALDDKKLIAEIKRIRKKAEADSYKSTALWVSIVTLSVIVVPVLIVLFCLFLPLWI